MEQTSDLCYASQITRCYYDAQETTTTQGLCKQHRKVNGKQSCNNTSKRRQKFNRSTVRYRCACRTNCYNIKSIGRGSEKKIVPDDPKKEYI